MSAASLPFLSFQSTPPSRGISLLSSFPFSLISSLTLSCFFVFLFFPSFSFFLSLEYAFSLSSSFDPPFPHFHGPIFLSYSCYEHPSRLLSSSFSFSLPLSMLPSWGVYMCNYYYAVVIHARLRHVQTRLVRVGRMVVFEYNMYPVYPTG